jgi:hypothetical protein
MADNKSAINRKQGKREPVQRFNITIPVKPYVKRFLDLNYGDPVYFHQDRDEYRVLRECLKNSRRYDSRYQEELKSYSLEAVLVISERDFYHFGWEMTKTNIVYLGTYIEMKAKTLMRSMIGIYHGLGLPISSSIHKFQDRFFYDDDVWPYQSIKKDYYRHGVNELINFDNEIFLKVEKIVLTNLYKKGTISHSMLTDHENDYKTR